MTEHEKILDKIRKLKALANPDANTSENEIAAALEIARKLMLEHGINESETWIHTEDEDLGGSFESFAKTKNRQIWISIIAQAMDTYFECQHIIRHGGGTELSFLFYGIKNQAEIASYCFSSVYNQVWSLSNSYKPSGCVFSTPRDFTRIAKREYREGLSAGILRRCRAIKEEEQQSAQASQITALAIRSDVVANEWLKKYEKRKNIEVKTEKQRSKRYTVGQQHFANGLRDSEKLTLAKAALKN